jgi:hypothetical protein
MIVRLQVEDERGWCELARREGADAAEDKMRAELITEMFPDRSAHAGARG